MATTTGLVQQVNVFGSTAAACVLIGASQSSAEVFVVQLRGGDTDSERAFKNAMLNLLVKTEQAGYPITVGHSDNGAEIQWVTIDNFNISPIGLAVHGDFYAITGTGVPRDAVVVFESTAVSVTVTPDLVRPHWVFVAQLPAVIPLGRNTVKLQTASWSSDAVPIDVVDNPVTTVRVLYSGAPKTSPYTIVLVANPAIAKATGNTFVADPVLTNRPSFHSAVSFCLNNILASTEDVLRQGDFDANIRFVAIFDATVAAADASSLAHELAPNIMEPRRDKLNAFLAGYFEVPDIVFVLHGSSTFNRAYSWFTTDDPNRAGTAFTYDGVNHTHGHFARIPGSTAVPVSATGLTPFHEFGHASSDFNDGMIVDLYVDGVGGFSANKKARAQSTDRVPTNFASYQTTTYVSDPNRDSLGYPNTWTSYHAQLIDASRPNMMDNYWLATAPANARTCRLDRLTYAWLSDRIRGKLDR